MSPVSVVGVSHLTAPVEIRERFAFAPGEAEVALGALRSETEVQEAVLLSTCNRTELYVCPGEMRAFKRRRSGCLRRRQAMWWAERNSTYIGTMARRRSAISIA